MTHRITIDTQRQHIRSQVTPFGGWPPEQKTFVVGWWVVRLTFEQITDELRPQIVNDLLYFKKIPREHVGDLLQQGWLRLWQALHEDSDLLADMTRIKAGDFVTNRAGATAFRDYLNRYDSYHNISRWNEVDDCYEDNITDIVIGSSLKSTGRGRHALFTRIADKFIDIEAAIRQVAEWCMDDIRKLAALYYLTTSVTQVDAGQIAGFSIVTTKAGRRRCKGIQHWARVVLRQLKLAFSNYKPIEPNRNAWRNELKSGNVNPVLKLAQRYEDEPDKLIALYVLTTSVARKTMVIECGIDDSKLWYATKQIRKELRREYARQVPA